MIRNQIYWRIYLKGLINSKIR